MEMEMEMEMGMDGFDQLPDSLVTEILNRVCDVKTLVGCRSLSRRFHSLVPQVDSLVLRVDRVDSPESDSDSPIVSFFRSIARSFLNLFPKPAIPDRIRFPNAPARILSRFDRIRSLEMEIPGGDVKLEKGAVVKWKAEFGAALKSCVIVAFRSVTDSVTVPENSVAGVGGGGEAEAEFARGLKPRVVWTISALVAASARHFLLRDVVKENESMEDLVLKDRDGEGTLVMDAEGLREYREARAAQVNEELDLVAEASPDRRRRTTVPSVRMSMRHAPKLRLRNGVFLEGATLVIVRPISEARIEADEVEMAMAAFGGGDDIYGEAVRTLVKGRRYLLEMNSF